MLDDREILNIIGQELSNASGGNENDFIEANRQAALATYLGQPNGKEVEGRSSVTSTDVADAIEWIMPEIVKSFTQNNEVVTFDPVGPGDEDQAELESQYVYDIFMKQNNGFLVVHQFVKDALMQKNGFVKVFYEESIEQTTEEYTGITEQEMAVIISDPEIEIITLSQYEEQQQPMYDFKVSRTVDDSGIRVVSVPPEEFRINEMHPSVDLTDARFSAHVMLKTAGELIEEGYDKELVDSLETYAEYDDSREYRFYMQNESVDPGSPMALSESSRPIEISECYTKLDIEGNGIQELYKVTVIGNTVPTKILDYEPVDGNPFVSTTAILMSHKLFGLSIYDRLLQIQEQKTALWRSLFDNIYLQNNQRTAIVENQVNIDDMLVSRPGGLVRVKTPNAIIPLVTPQLSGDSYQMMDYLDKVRTGRSGVTPDAPIQDSMIGDRVGSEGVEKMMTQREELVGLMIRVIAETGIKPICNKIREQAIKHQDAVKDYKFRGMWVQVNPTHWRRRSMSTVRVGTGSGDRKQQASTLTNIMLLQEKVMANPGQALMKEDNVYNAISDFAKASGLAGVSKYFIDPRSPEGQQHKQQVDKKNQEAQQKQEQQDMALAQAQMKIADAEAEKARAQTQNVALKAEIDNGKNQLTLQKQTSQAEIDHLKQQLEEAKTLYTASKDSADIDFRYYDSDQRAQVEKRRIDVQKEIAVLNKKECDEGESDG